MGSHGMLYLVIGTASSKYFEGLLFILVRRPYGIGDCIHVSDPNSDTCYTGSGFWCVEDISLFSTQVVSLLSVDGCECLFRFEYEILIAFLFLFEISAILLH